MAGIYVHIPFCKQKCSYCDFHFSTTFASYRARMIAAMKKEIEVRADYLGQQPVQTIYFGGGTPSLLTKEEIQGLLAVINQRFDVTPDAEVTLEANPDDCTESNLRDWKELGVNRLSIGVQSFKKFDLEWMNRAHTVEEATRCVQLAQNTGFANITVDLMYGLPGLTESEWRSHVQTVIDWGVPHVSSYCLTVEERTGLSHKVANGDLHVPDDETQSRHFEILLETLEANGIMQYEISNFGKPGFESRHNTNYWKGVWYLGIGPSAHSFNGTSRSWNVANNSRYMSLIDHGSPSFAEEVLEPKDRFNELLLTGLRMTQGVSLDQLKAVAELPKTFMTQVDDFESAGWMTHTEDRLKLTREGRLRADYIASELFIID